MLDFAAHQLTIDDQKINPQYRYQINCQLISLFMTQQCQHYSAIPIQPERQQRCIRDPVDKDDSSTQGKTRPTDDPPKKPLRSAANPLL